MRAANKPTSRRSTGAPRHPCDHVAYGGAGNDVLYGGNHIDTIFGGAGNDRINGGAMGGTLYGEAGNDTFESGFGSSTVDGGSGSDTLSYATSYSSIKVDGEARTVKYGNPGGTDHHQSIEKIVGSAYGDEFFGSGGVALDGYLGNDILTAGAGADKMNGGAGNDIVTYHESTAGVTVNLGSGAASGGWAKGDKLSGFETLWGSHHDDKLTGWSAANAINGNGGNDKIDGGGGSDSLYGSYGNDQIKGGAGNDEIFGEWGADTLWGGSGADRFVFIYESDSPAAAGQRDVIRDFSHSQGDKIVLSYLPGSLNFIGNAAFSGSGQVRFQQSGGNTVVEVNTIGNSGAEMAIQLSGSINLQASDFIL